MKVDGTPYLCKADEVGEICVNSGTTGMAYFGLLGITKNVFEVCLFPMQCCIPSISSCKQTFVSDTFNFVLYYLLSFILHVRTCQLSLYSAVPYSDSVGISFHLSLT